MFKFLALIYKVTTNHYNSVHGPPFLAYVISNFLLSHPTFVELIVMVSVYSYLP